MKLRFRRLGCLTIFGAVVGLILFINYPVNWAYSYVSWCNLSKEELVTKANLYVAKRAPGNAACLYAVDCSSGRATLRLIRSIEDWDIEAAKQTTWDRRFSDYCPGETANFALQLAHDNPHYAETFDGNRDAVWSFYTDRFFPGRTRFGFAAFSEGNPEPCLTANAITTPPLTPPSSPASQSRSAPSSVAPAR